MNQVSMEEKTFDVYLNQRLKSFGLDEVVYSEYIKGILLEFTNENELKESLNEVLSVVLDESVSETVNELVDCWNQFLIAEQKNQPIETNVKEDRIKTLIEQQQKSEQKKKTVADVLNDDLKSRLLEQYAELSGEEERYFNFLIQPFHEWHAITHIYLSTHLN